MPFLVTSDLHFTDNPRDEYRWGLWSWFRQQVREYECSHVFILGDITDAKDRHSARLVNRLVDACAVLARECEVELLRGNHDGLNPLQPFFRFVRAIPRVHMYCLPRGLTIPRGKTRGSWTGWVVPHTRTPLAWFREFNHGMCDFIFMHQTVQGSRSENGQTLSGLPVSKVTGARVCTISGDVHVPQRFRSGLIYVGAPYHIRFGDSFQPRVLLVRNNASLHDLHFPAPRRHLLRVRDAGGVTDADTSAGDQVKVLVRMRRADMPDWPKMREAVAKACAGRELDVVSLAAEIVPETARRALAPDRKHRSDAEVVSEYARRERLEPAVREDGLSFLGDGAHEV